MGSAGSVGHEATLAHAIECDAQSRSHVANRLHEKRLNEWGWTLSCKGTRPRLDAFRYPPSECRRQGQSIVGPLIGYWLTA
jgi:hypothetical protein